MTATAELIDRLARGAAPVSRFAVARRLAVGLGAGALASAILMVFALGPRPDFVAAGGAGAFWLKSAYTLGLALAGLWAADRLARPAGTAREALLLGALILAAAVGLGAAELFAAPPVERRSLMLGATAERCPWLILGLALPILAGAVWAMRGLAPTRLTAAGTAAGLAAGAAGAWVYSFHCPESAMPFVAIWYTAGIAAAGAVGALISRWALRW